MVQWLRIKSELDTQKNLGMIFSVMDNEYFLLFSEVRSASGKKNRKKKEKKKSSRKRIGTRNSECFFFFFTCGTDFAKKQGLLVVC